MTYAQFLDDKRIVDPPTGFEPSDLNPALYDFQRDIVRWALRRGRAAVFADCGLGKTLMQLEWARQVALRTGEPVLILTPPSVREQMRAEGEAFGIPCNIADSDADVKWALCPDLKPYKGVFITNYEKLHKFDTRKFSGVALDESSCLKAYDSKTRGQVVECFRHTPYRSAWTATPAPNDYMELGNHAEFIGAMSRSEMLSMFFVHDGGDTSKWRLKKHALSDYWQWMCSWSVMIRKPSDLGYDDGPFILPALMMHERIVGTSMKSDGMLFPMNALTLNERRTARRGSISERCRMVEEIAKESSGKVLVWCDLNDEQKSVSVLLNGSSVSIEGSTPEQDRTDMEREWRTGATKCLVSKPSIYGWGMNWFHCDTVIYCGISDSYESLYQSVRRCWRYGQKNPVNAHIIISEPELEVLKNIKRKQAEADRMAIEMVSHMSEISSAAIKGTMRTMTSYNPEKEMIVPTWLESEAA